MNIRAFVVRSSIVAFLAGGVSACGSERTSEDSDSAKTTATTATLSAPAYRDGTVTTVTPAELVLQTAEGEESFLIDQAVAPVLGLGHIASHAGAGIGFRIFFKEQDGKRYLVRGEELGPAQ